MVYNVLSWCCSGWSMPAAAAIRRRHPAQRTMVMRLLLVSFVFQIWHTVEHVVKMWQYFETGLNGTPGILGYWIPVVYLHLGYNTLLYLPIVLAFFVGGFPSSPALRTPLRGRRGVARLRAPSCVRSAMHRRPSAIGRGAA